MKKYRLLILMGALLVLAALVFSAGQEEKVEKAKLQLYFPSSTSSPLAEALQTLSGKYNATNPAIQVDAIYGGGQLQNVTKALTAFTGGNPPDMIIASAQDSYTFFDARAIVPIDEYVNKAGGKSFLNDFFQPFLGTSWIEGKQYGIPWQKSTALLYWNKDIYNKTGLDSEKAPSNWNELIEIGKKLTIRDASGEVKQWAYAQIMDFWVLQAYAYQAGSKGFSDPNGKFAYMDDPITIQSLKYVCDMINKHKIAAQKRTGGEASNDFASEFAAMLLHSTGNQGFLRNNAKFNWGAAFLPAGPKGYGATVGGAQFYIFKTNEARQSASWDFIMWMTQPENTAYWMLKTGYLALKPKALEVQFLKEFTQQDPRSLVAFDQLEYAKNDPVWHQGRKALEMIDESIFDAIYEKKTPEDAMADVQKELDAILARYR